MQWCGTFPLLSADEATSGVLHLVLGSLVQAGCTGANPVKDNADDEGIGTLLIR